MPATGHERQAQPRRTQGTGDDAAEAGSAATEEGKDRMSTPIFLLIVLAAFLLGLVVGAVVAVTFGKSVEASE